VPPATSKPRFTRRPPASLPGQQLSAGFLQLARAAQIGFRREHLRVDSVGALSKTSLIAPRRSAFPCRRAGTNNTNVVAPGSGDKSLVPERGRIPGRYSVKVIELKTARGVFDHDVANSG
jgi:hypothetical protein